MQQYSSFEASLEHLGERLRSGRRGIRVGRIDIRQGGIERSVPEMLPYKEGVRTLLNHEHGSGMF